MRLVHLFEALNQPKIVAVFPGRFQLFHHGHKQVFEALKQEFGDAYLATSNVTACPDSPFTFEEKKQLAIAAGIPSNRIVLTKQPYRPTELTEQFDASKDILVLGLSTKDASRMPNGKRPDGTSYYMQKWKGVKHAKPMNEHGYFYLIPTKTFKIHNKDVTSASELREFYKTANEDARASLILELYGNSDVKSVVDNKLLNPITEETDGSDSPLTVVASKKWRDYKKHPDADPGDEEWFEKIFDLPYLKRGIGKKPKKIKD